MKTLIGWARTFTRHDRKVPKRLVRLIGEKGMKAVHNQHHDHVHVAGVIIERLVKRRSSSRILNVLSTIVS